MSALLWLAAAIVLVVAEMFGGELVLLMLAGGAFAAAGVDFVWEAPPLWVEGLVFAVVSVLLLVAVRPVAKRHMLTRPAVLMNTEALEGQPAVVTEKVDRHDGRVKIGGRHLVGPDDGSGAGHRTRYPRDRRADRRCDRRGVASLMLDPPYLLDASRER